MLFFLKKQPHKQINEDVLSGRKYDTDKSEQYFETECGWFISPVIWSSAPMPDKARSLKLEKKKRNLKNSRGLCWSFKLASTYAMRQFNAMKLKRNCPHVTVSMGARAKYCTQPVNPYVQVMYRTLIFKQTILSLSLWSVVCILREHPNWIHFGIKYVKKVKCNDSL